LEGAAPEVMETSVIDPIEDAVMTVEGLKSISSSAKQSSASITLEFDLDKNIDVALQEVQTKVAQAQRRLPKDIDPAVITKFNPEDQPIMWLALSYNKNDPEFLMKYARNSVRDKFTTVPGVGQIFLGGYVDPALRVWVQPEKLDRYNIAVNDIISAIQSEHRELPGGLIEQGKEAYNVRTMGEAKSIQEFGTINISKRAGLAVQDPTNMLKLSDVARIEEGLNDIRRISRFNRESAIGLGIVKQRGSNAVEVAENVTKVVNEFQKSLPEGVSLKVNFDSTRFIKYSIKELEKHLLLAILLTSIVCLLFLGSWSATFNVLLSIPTSIMGAFIGMYVFNFTLNTFSLLGLTLAIGIVVDDAIMVLENIFRYQQLKKGKVESAIMGTREIAFAALAATVAVIAIFLPVAFMKGIIGKFFLQFGVTISLAVLFSLLEALTITPMRASSFTASHERTTRLGRWIEASMRAMEVSYKKWLVFLLPHRGKVVIGSIVFMVLSFFTVKFVNKEFTPAQDQSLFLIRMQTPVGSSIQYTDKVTKDVEDWLYSQKEIKQVYAAVGGFGGGAGEGNTSMFFVTLVPKADRKMSQQSFMNYARTEISKIKDAKARMQDLSMRGFSQGRGMPIEFLITGADWGTLWDSTQKIMEEMKNSKMMVDVDSNYLMGMPEVQVKPDRISAAMHGVSIESIGQTINSLIGGVKVGDYESGGRRYDIRLQLEKENVRTDEINKLLISNARGNLVPLSRVVKVDQGDSLQQISRVDRSRAISVYANLAPKVSQQDALSFVETKAKAILPEGYVFKNQGSSKEMQATFSNLLLALVLGFIISYMVLASQFNSFIDPVTVLMALPFAISGALFALAGTFQSLNIYSMIGILLLMGIVKKNSIMLVEFTNQVREKQDLPVKEALLTACPIRLRPILMTSLATIAAAIPSAVATGDGSEVFKPMAITIIGGVLLSTVLTLFVVPCFYLMTERFRKTHKLNKEIKMAFEKVDHLSNGRAPEHTL
jgi:HAE1 family hydrophobic/amphiphilic exporter-1